MAGRVGGGAAEGEGDECWRGRGGGGGGLCLTLLFHHRNDSCIKMGSDVSRF